jgi:RecA-family ATPase
MSGDPNAADDVSQLTRVLALIANATQAVVILIAHSPKSSMRKEGASDASEIFGSGAFTDNTRGTFVLHTMRTEEAKTYGKDDYERSDYVCLTNVKANYGKAGGEWWFRKESVHDWQIGKLVPETLYNAKMFTQFSGLSKRLVDLVKTKPGTLTVSKIRGLAGKQGELGASERKVRNTLARLIEEGELVVETLTKPERAERGLSANVKEVLNLPTAG